MRDPALAFVLHQLRQQSRKLYLLLDAARDPAVLALVRNPLNAASSLYEADRARLLDDVAPYLAPLELESPLLEAFLASGWGRSWGFLVTCDAPLMTLREHLRRLLRVVTEEGERLSLRFYDPRVMRWLLPACADAERAVIFGPMEHLVIEARAGERTHLFDRPRGQFAASREREALLPFVIRPPHLDALANATLEAFVDRVVEHLQTEFQAVSQRLGEAGLRTVVERGLARAREASLESESAVASYIELWFRFGIEFDLASERARSIRADGSLTESDKLSQLERIGSSALAVGASAPPP